jgi:hypothetical protein
MFVVPHHWFSLTARAIQPVYVRALTFASPKTSRFHPAAGKYALLFAARQPLPDEHGQPVG